MKAKKLKLEKDGKITENDSQIGYVAYEVDRKHAKNGILNTFKDDDEIEDKLKTIRMPKEFTFVWINKIYVKQSKRGKGYGSKIIEAIQRKYKKNNVVLGLSPGELVKTTDFRRLLPFYKKLGFKILVTDKHYYGFKIIKPSI
jgi:GNAT superfamily N-acetyltransferase